MKSRWRHHKETKLSNAEWHSLSDFCRCDCGRQYVLTVHVRTEGEGAAFVDALSFGRSPFQSTREAVTMRAKPIPAEPVDNIDHDVTPGFEEGDIGSWEGSDEV